MKSVRRDILIEKQRYRYKINLSRYYPTSFDIPVTALKIRKSSIHRAATHLTKALSELFLRIVHLNKLNNVKQSRFEKTLIDAVMDGKLKVVMIVMTFNNHSG